MIETKEVEEKENMIVCETKEAAEETPKNVIETKEVKEKEDIIVYETKHTHEKSFKNLIIYLKRLFNTIVLIQLPLSHTCKAIQNE